MTATVEAILGRPGATASGPGLFLGLDMHKDSIAVSLAPSDPRPGRPRPGSKAIYKEGPPEKKTPGD